LSRSRVLLAILNTKTRDTPGHWHREGVDDRDGQHALRGVAGPQAATGAHVRVGQLRGGDTLSMIQARIFYINVVVPACVPLYCVPKCIIPKLQRKSLNWVWNHTYIKVAIPL
jgi:hypothetical protein